MNNTNLQIYGFLGLLGVLGPILFPAYTLSIAFLWVMVVMATTWDALGGQMGYNSLGNITFFGVGMYVSAIVQVAMFYEGGVLSTHQQWVPLSQNSQQYSIFLGYF
tara:strand:- start:158 stop:475 length:318 start_codon:yes stop_codon:yes gene_type:complete